MRTAPGLKRWFDLDTAMREQIAEANPVQFLCDVASGKPFKAAPTPGRGVMTIIPTAKMRIDAARVLTAKVLPDLTIASVEATVEVSGHEDALKALGAVVVDITPTALPIAAPAAIEQPIQQDEDATVDQVPTPSANEAPPAAVHVPGTQEEPAPADDIEAMLQ